MTSARISFKRLFAQLFVILGIMAAASAPVQANEAEFKRLDRLSTQAEARGDFNQAIRLSLKMLEIKPNDVPTMLALSGLYGKAELPEQQLIWAKKILKLQPRHVDALINQGNAQAALGNTTAAKMSYDQARSIDPKSPLPVYSLGVLAQSQNRDAEAIGLFQQALKSSPDFEDALFNLAVGYANIGRTKEAISTLDRLLKIIPGAMDAQSLRSTLMSK